MQLEFAARGRTGHGAYPLAFELLEANGDVVEPQDLAPFTHALLSDVTRRLTRAEIAAKFHTGLVDAAVRVAAQAEISRVVLSGGCFQNQLLLGTVTQALEARGHRVYSAHQVPPNDGGIAAGQAVVAARHG